MRLPQPLAVPVAAKPSEVEEAAAAYGVEGPSGLAQDFALGWPWQLWERRQFLGRTALWGLVLSTLAAFVIPKRYESTTQLMPPDTQSSSGMAMMAALGGKGGTGLSSLADGLLGMKSTGDLFISILHSRTVEDRLVERFDLRRAYLGQVPAKRSQKPGQKHRDFRGPQKRRHRYHRNRTAIRSALHRWHALTSRSWTGW